MNNHEVIPGQRLAGNDELEALRKQLGFDSPQDLADYIARCGRSAIDQLRADGVEEDYLGYDYDAYYLVQQDTPDTL